jgi:hypothetical protein
MSKQMGWGGGLVLVVVIALSAGGITYLTERVFCSLAPGFPFLGDSCSTDPRQWALVMAVAVGGVSLIGLLLVQLRDRKRAAELRSRSSRRS